MDTYRPTSLDNYIGQPILKGNIQTLLTAAKKDGRPVDHILLYSQPGCGKTTLAKIIAHEMGGRLIAEIAPAIQTVGDLVQILLRLKRGDVLFIDEIHSLTRKTEETLYTAAESFYVDITVGNEAVRTLHIPLPAFTLVGATTRVSKVSQPLRDRFNGGVFQVQYYTPLELGQILKTASEKLEIQISAEAITILASRGRGTPRVTLNLLTWASNTAKAMGSIVDEELALTALDAKGIDELGLENDHRQYLVTLLKRGGCAGLKSMCRMMNREESDIETLEADLLRAGLIEYGDEGRRITRNGELHAMKYDASLAVRPEGMTKL